MNKRFKAALQASFEAPPPTGKEKFFKTLGYPKTTYGSFFASQLFYIRKRVWLLSFLIVIVSCGIVFQAQTFGNWDPEAWKIGSISAMLPFLAMLTVTEIYRSAAYRMAELEMSCRFSLQQILAARLTLLGGGNFAVLMLLMYFSSRIADFKLLQAITYLIVPYFIVCGFCLWLLIHLRGQEGVYGCAAAACLVSVANILLSNGAPLLYSYAHLNGWLVLLALSGIFMGVQIRKLLKQGEELTWNLLLTE